MRESLKAKAYREMGRMILAGVLAPGEFVNRRNLALLLGMSVAPVLEAALLLEAEGLLETLPRKGTRVRIHRLEDVRGHFLVREALECQAARMVFGRPVALAFDGLVKLARAVDAARDNGPPLWEAEVAFHCALADLAGSPVFSDAFRKAVRSDLFYKLKYVVAGSDESRRSHLRLLESLRDAKTAAQAETLTRAELRTGKAALFMTSEPKGSNR